MAGSGTNNQDGRLPILYSFRRCPYAMRARLAIASSGVSCELREVLLRDKPGAMVQASPKATVPVIVDVDGTVIDESLDIMLWALHRHDPGRWLRPEQGDAHAMLDLIAQCDTTFKHHLDRYKYPQRYEGAVASVHRDEAARWLMQLEARLGKTSFLFGNRPALADMAIAPFVRQYAHTDKVWFEEQDWPRLRQWLSGWMDGALFASVMQKYARWTEDGPGERFPSVET
ncbi:MAG TPA: glutathione S-transferase [Burkholderiaceae bacterium]|nr:glutathione S-transferase [Burkholderiaceae bacterium]